MTRKTSLKSIKLALMILSIGSSCSAGQLAPPRLEDRRLLLCQDKAAFCYPYERCVTMILGLCFKTEWVMETFDLTDPLVRKQLKDMGFTATSDRRWQ